MAVKSQLFEGKRFMWDGQEYEDKKKAAAAEKEYREKGFDVRSCSEDGKIVVYTRRVATEVVLT
jgi:ribosomal protein L34